MNHQIETQLDDKRKTAYSKIDVVKLDTKCLYAGKLERVKQWKEKKHEHPFCEILFVLAGHGETVVDADGPGPWLWPAAATGEGAFLRASVRGIFQESGVSSCTPVPSVLFSMGGCNVLHSPAGRLACVSL